MKTTYPKFKVSQYLDTSPESLSKPEADIYYGVHIKLDKGRAWLPVGNSQGPFTFKTQAEASELLEKCRQPVAV